MGFSNKCATCTIMGQNPNKNKQKHYQIHKNSSFFISIKLQKGKTCVFTFLKKILNIYNISKTFHFVQDIFISLCFILQNKSLMIRYASFDLMDPAPLSLLACFFPGTKPHWNTNGGSPHVTGTEPKIGDDVISNGGQRIMGNSCAHTKKQTCQKHKCSKANHILGNNIITNHKVLKIYRNPLSPQSHRQLPMTV